MLNKKDGFVLLVEYVLSYICERDLYYIVPNLSF